MGFYYFSILSLAPLAIAYGLLLLVFWGIAHLTRAPDEAAHVGDSASSGCSRSSPTIRFAPVPSMIRRRIVPEM